MNKMNNRKIIKSWFWLLLRPSFLQSSSLCSDRVENSPLVKGEIIMQPREIEGKTQKTRRGKELLWHSLWLVSQLFRRGICLSCGVQTTLIRPSYRKKLLMISYVIPNFENDMKRCSQINEVFTKKSYFATLVDICVDTDRLTHRKLTQLLDSRLIIGG